MDKKLIAKNVGKLVVSVFLAGMSAKGLCDDVARINRCTYELDKELRKSKKEA